MKLPADRRNKYKYCDFHQDVGHNTSECYSLRNQIEGLVRGGLLTEFLQQVRDGIKTGKQVQKEIREPEERRKNQGKDLMEQIQMVHTISGGPTLVGTSNNSRKNHARKVPRCDAASQVFKVSTPGPTRSTQIIFTEDDAYNTVQPHDDPMVVTVQVANNRVARVMIDTGSSVDIIFKDALDRCQLRQPCFYSCTTPLTASRETL